MYHLNSSSVLESRLIKISSHDRHSSHVLSKSDKRCLMFQYLNNLRSIECFMFHDKRIIERKGNRWITYRSWAVQQQSDLDLLPWERLRALQPLHKQVPRYQRQGWTNGLEASPIRNIALALRPCNKKLKHRVTYWHTLNPTGKWERWGCEHLPIQSSADLRFVNIFYVAYYFHFNYFFPNSFHTEKLFIAKYVLFYTDNSEKY